MAPTTQEVKDKGGFVGYVTVGNFVLSTPEAVEIDSLLSTAENMPRAEYDKHVARLREICEFRTVRRKNSVVLSGRSIYARIALGDLTYTGIINYGCLGTSSAAVLDANTQLGTEVKRKGIASSSRSGSSFTIDFYYSKADTSGTYQEFGMVVDGTVTANTGQLFNRVLTGGWTKSATEAMTVSIQIDFNAS